MSKDMEQRRKVRDAGQSMARKMGLVVDDIRKEIGKEMAYAVHDIRQQVVERGWFDRVVTPELVKEWDAEKKSDRDIEREGARDFSREDLYGKETNWENMRDVMQDHHRDRKAEAQWESEKDKAQELYGPEREKGLER